MTAALSLYAEITPSEKLEKVSLIKLNKEEFSDSPSITHFELKILCLQCSELICENIINSQSVGLLPRSS